MTLIGIVSVLLCCGALILASYVQRIYAESGKLLSRDFQTNIDVYESEVEPHLGKDQRRIEASVGLLAQLLNTAITLIFAFDLLPPFGHQPELELLQLVIAVVLTLLICDRVLPFLLLMRTRGQWIVKFTHTLKALLLIISPVTLVLSFCMQVAALAEPNSPETQESSSDGVEALIEAGEEEGILEEGDRELITSVVEFGDKVTREAMTPRPEIFAVPLDTTIERLTELLRERSKSRIPVYEGTLDNIRGIVFTHDLLQVSDEEAVSRSVASLLRPAYFVPESKKTNELLREMQQRKIQIAIVIDEYGAVAGLVTVEDLVEEIIGEVHDERDVADIIREREGAFIVHGTMDLDRLDDLFGIRITDEHEASTVGGYISEKLGRIPKAGEVIGESGLHFEITQSSDRRIEKIRISRMVESEVNKNGVNA